MYISLHASSTTYVLADVYGQLGDEYATQRGGAMEPTGKMIKRLLGMME